MGEDTGEFSRRDFLKKIAAIAAGFTTGFGAVAVVHQKPEPEPALQNPPIPETPAPDPTPVPMQTPEHTFTDYRKIYQDPVGERMNAYRTAVKNEVMFLLTEEKQKKHISSAIDTVVHQIVLHYYKRENLDGDLMLASNPRWKEIAQDVAHQLDLKSNSFSARFLPGLILTESVGNPNAVSAAGAEGICQLKAGPAEQMYSAMRQRFNRLTQQLESKPELQRRATNLQKVLSGIKFRNNKNTGIREIDLSDPYTNITLALEHIDYLYAIFPDPSLALWAYHLGAGNMVRAIVAARDKPEAVGEQLVADISKFESAGKALATIHEFIHGKSDEDMLDFTVLFDNPAVGRRLSNIKVGDKTISAWEDDTYFYTARVVGGGVLLYEYSEKQKKNV